MNINNVEDPKVVPDNIWKEIFGKQWELALKYKDIENMGDLLESLDTNIDTANGQKWIKDFAWRVTEELTEAQEALIGFEKLEQDITTHNPADDPDLVLDLMVKANQYLQHYVEELIDALHFLTELTLICGYNEDIIELEIEDIAEELSWYDVVYRLGLMCNCLKNKPWKQTQMLTDRVKFKNYLQQTWAALYVVLRNRISDEQIYLFYFKKNEVNQFRIRSKY